MLNQTLTRQWRQGRWLGTMEFDSLSCLIWSPTEYIARDVETYLVVDSFAVEKNGSNQNYRVLKLLLVLGLSVLSQQMLSKRLQWCALLIQQSLSCKLQ